LGEGAHGRDLDPLVGEGDRGAEDPVPVQAVPAWCLLLLSDRDRLRWERR